jgi:hypothetical protein
MPLFPRSLAACLLAVAIGAPATGLAEGPTASTRVAGPAAQSGKKRPARLRQFRLPIGTRLPVHLRTPVGSATSLVDDQVDAKLAEVVTQDGLELIPAGSLVHGKVVEVVPASPKGEPARITLVFAVVQHALTQSRAAIRTRTVTLEAPVGDPKKPADVALGAGYPMVLTLSEPLLVYLPPAAAR